MGTTDLSDDEIAPTEISESAGRSPLSPMNRDNLSDRAYQQIREALLESRLVPGEKLRLRPLSERLGLSATPVREALLRLVTEQALEIDSRGTICVPEYDRERLIEIRDLRVELEGRAAAQAADLANAQDIAALNGMHEAMMVAERSGDYSAALAANEQFHVHLTKVSNMPVLQRIVESLWLQCGPVLNHLYDDGPPQFSRHPHTIIIQGLEVGDPGMARGAITEDIIHGGLGLLYSPPATRR